MLIRFYGYASKDSVNGQAARLLCSEELPQRRRQVFHQVRRAPRHS